MPFARRAFIFAFVTLVSVALDQVTKVIATRTLTPGITYQHFADLFRWQLARNEGAFLSLGAGLPPGARFWVLTVGVGALLVGIGIYALTAKVMDDAHVAGYALIASGGLSNWVDRARFDGSVVDFMNLGIGTTLRTGVFNVADLAIIAGIVVLLIAGWRHDKRKKAEEAKAAQAAQPIKPEV